MPNNKQQGSIIIIIIMISLMASLSSALALQMLSQQLREHNLTKINTQSWQISTQTSQLLSNQLLDHHKPNLMTKDQRFEQKIKGLSYTTVTNFKKYHAIAYSGAGYSLINQIGAVHYQLETKTSTDQSQTSKLITGYVCNGILHDQKLDNRPLQGYFPTLNQHHYIDFNVRLDSVSAQLFIKTANQPERLFAQLKLNPDQLFSRAELFIYNHPKKRILVISVAKYTPTQRQTNNHYYLLFIDIESIESPHHILSEDDLKRLNEHTDMEMSHWGYLHKLEPNQLLVSATLAYANKLFFITQIPYINSTTGDINYKNKLQWFDLNPQATQHINSRALKTSSHILQLSTHGSVLSSTAYVGVTDQPGLLSFNYQCKKTHRNE